jgi:thioredoxin reductase (NADPH)
MVKKSILISTLFLLPLGLAYVGKENLFCGQPAVIEKRAHTELKSEYLEDVVIIGSGPAGLTAAIYMAQAGLKPVVIAGNNQGGQLVKTSSITNWPGIEKMAGSDLMNLLETHAQNAGARILADEVLTVNFGEKPFVLETAEGKTITARAVIIATGSTPKMLNIPGEEKYWGNGISNCAICDGALYKKKKVAVIGGGNTAFEQVEHLKNFTDDITIIVRAGELAGFAVNRDKVLKNPKIKIQYNTGATEFFGDEDGITHLMLENKKTKQKHKEKFDGVFLAIGSRPNTAIFKDQLELTPSGYVKTYNDVKTSVTGVFVAGDVREVNYRQAIISAASGSVAALEAEKYLAHMR